MSGDRAQEIIKADIIGMIKAGGSLVEEETKEQRLLICSTCPKKGIKNILGIFIIKLVWSIKFFNNAKFLVGSF